MKDFIKFIKEFIENKGLTVFLSSIIGKICLFINVIVVVRLISENEFGLITLAATVFGIFAPFIGLGSYQGLLRYGSLGNDENYKDSLSFYVLKKGFLNHLLISIPYIIINLMYTYKYKHIIILVICFYIRFIGFYFFNFIQVYYRIRNNNKLFAKINIIISILGLLLAVLFTYIYGITGYLISIAITPWLSLFFYKPLYKKKKIGSFSPIDINKKEFWKYSLFSSTSYFFSEILFYMDIFFISILLNEKSIAYYKIAIVIPMSLMFIPLTFIQTDFPKLAKNYNNKEYLKFYINNYYKLFIPLGIIILLVSFFIKDDIIPIIFGDTYTKNGWIFFILISAVVANMWLRNLYGNLIAAIGEAKWNTYIAIGAILSMSFLCLTLIPSLDIVGAALSIAITFVLTGILGFIMFTHYLKKIT